MPGVSPGVVEDCEFLLRELYFPEHSAVEDGSELTVRAIPVTDLIEKGFSVHRKSHVGAARMKELIDERLGRPRLGVAWRSLGVAKLKAEAVRRLRICGDAHRGDLVIIDTATKELPWHASVHAARVGTTKSRGRELRDLLLPLLARHVMTVDEAYATSDP